MSNELPIERLRHANTQPVREGARYVLYWMIAARRVRWNFALEHALEQANRLDLPLLVFEPLRVDYPWASARIHRWVLDGMADNAKRLKQAGVRYLPYVEPEPGAGRGLLAALAEHAALVVTDEFPSFFLPHMVAAAAARLDVRVDVVDGNGLMPLAATQRAFPTAHSFRRFLQKGLPDHLDRFPTPTPLGGRAITRKAAVPRAILRRWPAASVELLRGEADTLEALPVDHGVPVLSQAGGSVSGERRLRTFVDHELERYADLRNRPEEDATSQLSPWLHFGHVSAHEVVARLLAKEDWSPKRLGVKTDGSREGWWGLSPAAEGFLDELVTWRELGYVFGHHRPEDYDRFESLPNWALETLEQHAGDERPHVYSRAQLENAATHDPLWNAAQTQLRRDGRIHNYLRMLWGKKILQWSSTPREALANLIELNNRWAIDGRNPNSYSGIFWTLGRFDRAWGPERPIFGKVRYMTSENTARKVSVKGYIERFSSQGELFG